jgi:MFS family permease
VAGWLLVVSVYLLAVLHRTSLGVAGLLAQHRFGISPAQLSVFIFLQIGVYAAMQVPTGVLVDRYGPRRVIIAAATLMGAGQLLFALVPSYPAGLVGRAVLGCGDALTFVSVLRVAATNFPPRRFPLFVSLTSMVGMLGNILATLPLAVLLHHAGWTTAFAVAAVLSLVTAVAVLVLLPEPPTRPRALRTFADVRRGTAAVWGRVRAAWALPGTRLGFWVHFACMSTTTSFGVLWAGPYLTTSAGFSTAGAGAVLMYGVITAALASPVLGWLIGRRPIVRVPIAIGTCAVTVAGWVVAITVFGATVPQWYATVLFVVTALGGPASMAAFALARDYNHSRTLGTASGVVNVGGFVATVIIALGIGWALDAQGGTTPEHFRWAVLVALGVQTLGTMRMAEWLFRLRAHVLHRQASGEDVPVPVLRRRWDRAT